MGDLCNTDAFQRLLSDLRQASESRSDVAFPADSLRKVQDAGGLRWNLPEDFGGLGLDSVSMLTVYRRLASACLATTFILTQRNAACARILSSDNESLKRRLLPELATGQLFATVGISHLTTSRQHLSRPAVAVSSQGDTHWLFRGTVPWVTAGSEAQLIVTGGVLDDGRQILAAVPTDRDGVHVRKPAQLMALTETATGAVELADVSVARDEVLHGPAERILTQGAGGGAGSLGTSAVAIGAAEGSLQQFAEEAVRRPQLREYLDPLQAEAEALVHQFDQTASAADPAPAEVERLRQQANSLVMRSAQAWLAATKGAGFMSGHPAERAVRESMFFLVWSCPQSVLEANLRELACTIAD